MPSGSNTSSRSSDIMEDPILITWLNDFVFCPVSIYFHNLYGDGSRVSFQDTYQINGTHAHENVDSGGYSTKKSILSGISVYCEKYGLTGKIDVFDIAKGELRERKKKIRQIYDGYVFQLYGQCFSLREMGYTVNKLVLYSMDDNKPYSIHLPENDPEMLQKFESLISNINSFSIYGFKQTVIEKCRHCIYEPLCDSSLLGKE